MSKKIAVGLLSLLFVLGLSGVGAVKYAHAEGINISQLIELLISIGVIAPDKVPAARAFINNSSQTTATSNTNQTTQATSPFISSVNPTSAPADGKTTVIVKGSNFNSTSKIYLANSAYNYADIKPNSIYTGGSELTFFVPTNLSIGKYVLQVLNDGGSGKSNPSNSVSFIVGAAGSSQSEIIISSALSVSWKRNTIGSWTWASKDSVTGVDIHIRGNAMYTFATNYPNTGWFQWNAGAAQTEWGIKELPNGNYTVYVCPTSIDITSTRCGSFKVNLYGDSTTQTNISLTSPNGGETFTAGDSMAIRWNVGNIGVGLVSLDLVDKNGYVERNIASGISNNGSYSWTIPRDIVQSGTTAAYKILISSYDKGPSAQDYSDSIFTVYPAQTSSQPLSASCSGTPNSDSQKITWSVTASGGSGSKSYSWNAYNDISAYTGGSTQSSSFTASYSSSGMKQATVTVTDTSGSSVWASCYTTLSSVATVKPTITYSNVSSTNPGGSITLYGSGFNSNQMISWSGYSTDGTKGYDTSFNNTGVSGGTAISFTVPSDMKAGTYDVQVYELGKTESNFVKISVIAPVTVQSLSASCSGTPGYDSASYLMWNASVSGGSTPYRYSWSVYNDVSSYSKGSTQSENVGVTYSSGGTKQAVIYVSDSAGKSISASCSASVSAPASATISSPTLSTYSWYADDPNTWPTVSTPSSLNSGQAIRVKGLDGSQYFNKTLGVNSGKLSSSPAAGTTQLILYVYDYNRSTYAVSERTVNVSITNTPVQNQTIEPEPEPEPSTEEEQSYNYRSSNLGAALISLEDVMKLLNVLR